MRTNFVDAGTLFCEEVYFNRAMGEILKYNDIN